MTGTVGLFLRRLFGIGTLLGRAFPKDEARALRLNALSEALRFLSRVGVDYVAFEDLLLIKGRRFTRSRSGNRKITLINQ